jgi:hypothetical protein
MGLTAAAVPHACGEPQRWIDLREGLAIGTFGPQERSSLDLTTSILRIDPRRYDFRLLSASEHGGKGRTTKAWCHEFGLLATINASMYYDHKPLQSTGYMRNYAHINNPRINPAFGAFMVFNPVDASLPPVQILDRHVRKDWQDLVNKYHTVVQNYRLVSGGARSGWSPGERILGTAAVGMDERDRVLFILSRGAQSTYDFIETLISLPIGLRTAMYVEGGLQASLYLRLSSPEGSPRTPQGGILNEWIGEASEWELPNVIGILEKR